MLDRHRFAFHFERGPAEPVLDALRPYRSPDGGFGHGLARRLFDDATIECHLDALAARRQPDGGWPITWEPPSPAAVLEWRGFVTIEALDVLRSYGRLPLG